MLGAKQLSYAGRLTLVNSVLTSLYTYWAAIFVIPKCVLKKIDAICRNYLWDGSTEYIRSPKVRWEKVCSPKCEGGLGVRDSYSWNLAAVGKLVWWVYHKPDSLWVKWISSVYLKGEIWANYSPKTDASLSWKAICKGREKLDAAYHNGQWTPCPTGYTVASGYNWIRKAQPQVPWFKLVWNNWCIPKHQFINWLIFRKALMLKAKLYNLGISTDDTCCLCGGASETHEHLFQHCPYVQLVCAQLEVKLGMKLPYLNVLEWVYNKPWSKVKKKVVNASLQAVYYAVWNQRNKARMEGQIIRPEHVIKDVISLLHMKSFFWLRSVKKDSDARWIRSLFINS